MRSLLLAVLLVGCADTDKTVVTDDVEDTDAGVDDTVVVDDSDGGDVPRHHPVGFFRPADHGLPAKLQDESCVTCHGDDLKGGTSKVSCDTCHPADWRTDCTFCHGDPADGTGSPPVHVSGQDDGAAASFVPHRAHTTTTAVKAAFDCTMCHTKPSDVLSEGHLFLGDATPGVAETDFAQSLSDKAVWTASTGTCSNLYCHGSAGKDNGRVVHTDQVGTCKGCHPDRSSNLLAWGSKMSGEHQKHLLEGLGCAECHAGTVDGNQHVSDVTQHVDGEADTQFPSGMVYSGGTCTGSCHGEGHGGRSWR